MIRFLPLVAGLLFGLGLSVSGMVNPAKVIGFLDLAGQWDPTLAVVMGTALLASAPAFRYIPRWSRPWLAERFSLPTRQDLDARLIAGAAIFGLGWGLAGICPGPGITALAGGESGVVYFVAAMSVGMVGFRFSPLGRPRRSGADGDAASRRP